MCLLLPTSVAYLDVHPGKRKDEEVDDEQWPRSDTPGSLNDFIVEDEAEGDKDVADEDLPVVDLNDSENEFIQAAEVVSHYVPMAARLKPAPPVSPSYPAYLEDPETPRKKGKGKASSSEQAKLAPQDKILV